MKGWDIDVIIKVVIIQNGFKKHTIGDEEMSWRNELNQYVKFWNRLSYTIFVIPWIILICSMTMGLMKLINLCKN